MDVVTQAKEVIATFPCAVLATVSADGTPWSTPVTVAYDQAYTFYWTSYAVTQHSKNLEHNPIAAMSICNSHEMSNKSGAVYLEVECEEMADEETIGKAVEILYARKGKEPREVSEFMGEDGKRMYRAVPKRVWFNSGKPTTEPTESPREEIQLV